MAGTAEELPAPPASSTESAPTSKPSNQHAPDPDDLDDLDDVLDEFSYTAAAGENPPASGPGRPAGSTSGPGRPAGSTSLPDAPVKPETSDKAAEEFSAELQKEMAALLGQIDESPEMRKQFNEMISEIQADVEKATDAENRKEGAAGESGAVVGSGSDKSPHSDKTPPPDAFQDTIRRTMERMQASGNRADASAEAGASADGEGDGADLLAQLMQEMSASAAGGDGPESEEDFSKVLLGMMEQLTNKEILYEPMKELHDRFPGWMEKNQNTVSADDMSRYKEQHRLVSDIVARFERKDYSDGNAADREYIVEKMQQMQVAGSPPADLVGDMKDMQDAMGGLDAGCAPQ